MGELPPRSPLQPVCEDGSFRTIKEERRRTPKELRELWQKAILQQILLLRMEKENQKLQGKYFPGSEFSFGQGLPHFAFWQKQEFNNAAVLWRIVLEFT